MQTSPYFFSIERDLSNPPKLRVWLNWNLPSPKPTPLLVVVFVVLSVFVSVRFGFVRVFVGVVNLAFLVRMRVVRIVVVVFVCMCNCFVRMFVFMFRHWLTPYFRPRSQVRVCVYCEIPRLLLLKMAMRRSRLSVIVISVWAGYNFAIGKAVGSNVALAPKFYL